jgi:hypothetical protein
MHEILKPAQSLEDVLIKEDNDYQAPDYPMNSDTKHVSSQALRMPSLDFQKGPRNLGSHAQTYSIRANYSSGLDLQPPQPAVASSSGRTLHHASSQRGYHPISKLSIRPQFTNRIPTTSKASFNVPTSIDPTLSSSKSAFSTL